jgi:hypothetical protein
VTLSADVSIPQRFTQPLLTPLEGDRYAQTRVTVRMADDGAALLDRFEFVAPPGGLRADELRRPDLAGLLQWAVEARVAQELMVARERTARGAAEIDGIEEVEIMYRAGQVASRRKRGPYRITDEFLTAVLGQEHDGGIKLIIKTHDVSERTARRWLRQAEERGLR